MKKSFRAFIALIGALFILTLALGSLAFANQTVENSAEISTVPPFRQANPSSGVYTLYDSIADGTPTFQWVEINSSADYTWDLGNSFLSDQDVSPVFPLGFLFPFYDDFYTEFEISERGYIFFKKAGEDTGSGTTIPRTVPDNQVGFGDINNFIAPFAGEMFGYPGISKVYVKNDTSNRRTIIEFENIVWCCGQNNPRTFEIILYPDGTIDMQYLKVANFPGSLDNDQDVIVGLENLEGSAGDVYYQGAFNSGDTNLWRDKMALRYDLHLTPGILFVPDPADIWDDPGQEVVLPLDLYFIDDTSVTRDFEIISQSLVISSTLPDSDWADTLTHTAFVPGLTGTYTGTVYFTATIPITADFNDIATVTLLARSTVGEITDTVTIAYGPAHRDLQIEKRIDPEIAPAVDGAFRYFITITNTDYNNSGRGAVARDIRVYDLLPANTVIEDCHRHEDYETCKPGLIETGTIGAFSVVTLSFNTLDVDEKRRIYLEMRNNNPLNTEVVNTALVTLTNGIELGFPDRNTDSVTFTVASPQSNLYVDKSYPYAFGNQRIVAAGQSIPFKIEMFNNGWVGPGNVRLQNVTLVDVIPDNTTFDRATTSLDYNGSQISPSVDGQTLTFNFSEMDNGFWNAENIWVWINVPQDTAEGTLLTNTVTVSDGTSSAEDTVVVEVGSNYLDPFIDKGPSVDSSGEIILPEPGKDYTYWITFGNRSVLNVAQDIVLTDTLPPSVTLVSASASSLLAGPVQSTVGDQTVLSWFTDTLPAGAFGRLLVIVRVDDNIPPGTPLANQLVMTYSGSYPPSTPVDDTDVLTLETPSDLKDSQKSVDKSSVSAGEIVEYTLVVENDNASLDIPFQVTDPLPTSQIALISLGTPTAGTASETGGTISWSGTLAPAEKATLTFTARVDPGVTVGEIIKNTATISNLYRSADIVVAGDVFGTSSKKTSVDLIASGETMEYIITAINTGDATRAFTVTDSLPLSVSLTNGLDSFRPTEEKTNVTLSPDNRSFTWQSTVAGGSESRLRVEVSMDQGIADGVVIDNIALLEADSGSVTRLTGTVTISNSAVVNTGGVYLPLIFK